MATPAIPSQRLNLGTAPDTAVVSLTTLQRAPGEVAADSSLGTSLNGVVVGGRPTLFSTPPEASC